MTEMGPLPMEHVERPLLPWRAPARKLSECGLPAGEGRVMLTRDEFAAKVRRQGKQRAALTTCITCWTTALRWPTWDENPVACMQRETHSASRHNFNAQGGAGFRQELLALAELVTRHRAEFDGLVEGLADTTDLSARRAARRRRPA